VTLYLEPKFLYNQPFAATPRPPKNYCFPFGRARVRRAGSDLSIITYGTTVHWSLRAAKRLKDEYGIEAEVLDLRSLAPLDKTAIFQTVKKTGKALVVHEDKLTGGFGGEVAALIAEYAFEYLDAPVMRVGGKDTPIGFSKILENAILPQVDDIFNAALKLAKY
jgi:2-oxoisovalerate dehydrogenase E1 component